MKPSLLLRFASGIALVQFAAHTILFVFSSPKHGPAESAVIEAMKAHRFDFMGSLRSYWDFYFGYGLEALEIFFHNPHRSRCRDRGMSCVGVRDSRLTHACGCRARNELGAAPAQLAGGDQRDC